MGQMGLGAESIYVLTIMYIIVSMGELFPKFQLSAVFICWRLLIHMKIAKVLRNCSLGQKEKETQRNMTWTNICTFSHCLFECSRHIVWT